MATHLVKNYLLMSSLNPSFCSIVLYPSILLFLKVRDQCLSWAQLGVSLKISTDAIWAGNKRWGSSDLFSHRKTSFCMMSFCFGNTSLIWILNIKLCMFLNCKTAEKFSREERLNKTIMSRLLLILGDFLASSKIILFYIESFLSNTLLFSPFSLNNTLFN